MGLAPQGIPRVPRVPVHCVLGLGEWVPIPVKQGGKIPGEVFLIETFDKTPEGDLEKEWGSLGRAEPKVAKGRCKGW